MRSVARCMVLLAGLTALLSLSEPLSAQYRWLYRYDGTESRWDEANSIAMGLDGNLVVAGSVSMGIGGTYADLAVIGLTDSGDSCWFYRFNGSASFLDEANSVAVGSDGNIYAAGYTYGTGTSSDFMIVRLDSLGVVHWVYLYNGPGNGDDELSSIVVGPDGNVYAAGYSDSAGTSLDLTVVSLTQSAALRWIYRYTSAGDFDDQAYSITMGPDGNLYIAGSSFGVGVWPDLTVVSLDTSGTERWVYRRDGSAFGIDEAYSIAAGGDGNIYAAGSSQETAGWFDFTVVSLDASGTERWVYIKDGPGNGLDELLSIAAGPDGNIYAAGRSEGAGTDFDFTVVSLDTLGTERWEYRYNDTTNQSDRAVSIAAGADCNIYAAGFSTGSGTSRDFTVVSLDSLGAERWVYLYDGPGNGDDEANSIVVGSDGYIYAAGYSVGSGTSGDFTVVSLSPDVGVEENLYPRSPADFRLWQNSPNPFHRSTLISYDLPVATHITLCIYDITGRLVETLVNETQQPGVHQLRWNRKDNPSGVYFCRLKTGEFVKTRKMVVVD